MNIVETMFRKRALIKGGLMLFSKPDAIAFCSQCEKENIKILGVDSFKVIGEKIQPSLENSIDYSNDNELDYELIVDFIKSRDDEFFFEIVCDE